MYVYPDRALKLYRTPDDLYQDMMKKSLMENAMIQGDMWELDGAGGFSGIIDLVSEEALYHLRCIRDFTRPTTKSQVIMHRNKIKRTCTIHDIGFLQILN